LEIAGFLTRPRLDISFRESATKSDEFRLLEKNEIESWKASERSTNYSSRLKTLLTRQFNILEHSFRVNRKAQLMISLMQFSTGGAEQEERSKERELSIKKWLTIRHFRIALAAQEQSPS
jgi:hypothetical protein